MFALPRAAPCVRQSQRSPRDRDTRHVQGSETHPEALDPERPEHPALPSQYMVSGSDQPHLNENSTPETCQTQQNSSLRLKLAAFAWAFQTSSDESCLARSETSSLLVAR